MKNLFKKRVEQRIEEYKQAVKECSDKDDIDQLWIRVEELEHVLEDIEQMDMLVNKR